MEHPQLKAFSFDKPQQGTRTINILFCLFVFPSHLPSNIQLGLPFGQKVSELIETDQGRQMVRVERVRDLSG